MKLQLSEKDYSAVAGGKGFNFLYQQIKDNINLQQTRNLIHSLCRNNNQLAQSIICMISQAISRHSEVRFIHFFHDDFAGSIRFNTIESYKDIYIFFIIKTLYFYIISGIRKNPMKKQLWLSGMPKTFIQIPYSLPKPNHSLKLMLSFCWYLITDI